MLFMIKAGRHWQRFPCRSLYWTCHILISGTKHDAILVFTASSIRVFYPRAHAFNAWFRLAATVPLIVHLGKKSANISGDSKETLRSAAGLSFALRIQLQIIWEL